MNRRAIEQGCRRQAPSSSTALQRYCEYALKKNLLSGAEQFRAHFNQKARHGGFDSKTSSKNARDYLAFDVRKPKIPAIAAISQALGIGTRQVEAVGGKPEWSDLPPNLVPVFSTSYGAERGT